MLKLLLEDMHTEANSIGISVGRRLPVYNENIRPRNAPFFHTDGVESLVL